MPSSDTDAVQPILVFDSPWILIPGLVLVVIALVVFSRVMQREKLNRLESLSLLALRTTALCTLLVLIARPVTVQKETPRENPYVAVLLDRSQSMSLAEGGTVSRFSQANSYLIDRLAPALRAAGFKVHPWLFADSAAPATASALQDAVPDGKSTDLADALIQSVSSEKEPPIAAVVLTDGEANQNKENSRAVSALLDRKVPVFCVGFGSDSGPSSLGLQRVTAPTIVPPKQEFRVSAELALSGGGDIPKFDLLLLRDGQLVQTKTVPAFSGARVWTETFPVIENEEGRHNYSVEMSPPTVENLVVGQTSGTAQVNILKEKAIRVLYVQGTLTWDYKFTLRALNSDPAIRVTGLSRTSDHSSYRQNVEKASELVEGFPVTLDQLSSYQVVVISNLKASDLTQAQQDLLTRFCGELGGGLLLIGGAETFDRSWQGSTLERLIPVTFDSGSGFSWDRRPFHLKLTDDALRNPIFQISDSSSKASAWDTLPAFTQYGPVEGAKPGAVVWAEHDSDVGPQGKRILMAAENFGAGRTAVICVQNFWRWRLAKNSDPEQFDRFWRQFYRWLGLGSNQRILIDFTDQDLTPPTDLHVVVERQLGTSDAADIPGNSAKSDDPTKNFYTISVKGPDQTELYHDNLNLPPNQPAAFSVHAEKEGLYSVVVSDSLNHEIAERNVDLVNRLLEMQNTARDMESLRQWSSISGGKAFPIEEAQDPSEIVDWIHRSVQEMVTGQLIRNPWGLNGWSLTILLTCLSLEWFLRKRWKLR